MSMYDNKTINDVIKYLYEQKQDELARVVIEQVRALAEAQAQKRQDNVMPPTPPSTPWYPPYWQSYCGPHS